MPRAFCLCIILITFVLGAVLHIFTPSKLRAWGDCPVEARGHFAPKAEYPSSGTDAISGIRTWGSWAGDDNHAGDLRIGPFPAPERLRLAVCGYPNRKGNELFLEMKDLGFRLPLNARHRGEQWKIETFEIPLGWRGRQVTLVALDRSSGHGGWLAVSEPLRSKADPLFGPGLGGALVSFAFVGALLGVAYLAAAERLETVAAIPAHWIPLLAGGVVGIGGYGAFWAYFAHPVAGRIYSILFVGASCVMWAAGRRRETASTAPPREWPRVAILTAGLGVFYIAWLHVFPSNRGFFDLAANRLIAGLPGDNRLSHDIAALLYHGMSPKAPGGDWLSSDRPPLQSGLQLLVWPISNVFGIGETTSSALTAVWLQLLWAPALYGMLRALNVSMRRGLAWLLAASLTGFCFLNSVYTWPKLCAGAFACGAFCLWFMPVPGPRHPRYAAAAALAALALLSHGGVAFALIPLAPCIVWRAIREKFSGWLIPAATGAILFAPWIAYQKLYEPPGNRLIKWHLGGQVTVDNRGAWQAIRDGYAASSLREAAASKLQNFRLQFGGHWSTLLPSGADDFRTNRRDEFNHMGRAMGWFSMGFLALPFALLTRAGRDRWRESKGAQTRLILWLVATAICWCLLLFNPEAMIFLGPYSLQLGLLALLISWAELAGKYGLLVIAALQGPLFYFSWISSAETLPAPLSLPAVAVALLTAGALTFAAKSIWSAAVLCRSLHAFWRAPAPSGPRP